MIWDVDKVCFSFYGVDIRWYGVCFLIGFWLAKSLFFFQADIKQSKVLERYVFFAMIIGARVAHVAFYDFANLFTLNLFKIWQGGLASHGGVAAVIFALYIFCKNHHKDFFYFLDLSVVPFLILAGFIRLGNFFNQELLGLPFDSFFSVTFRSPFNFYNVVPRHPVQIYAMLFYWVLAFVFYKQQNSDGQKFFSAVLLVSIFRIFLEYFKEPVGLIWGFKMGQVLSIPFVLTSIYFLMISKKQKSFYRDIQ